MLRADAAHEGRRRAGQATLDSRRGRFQHRLDQIYGQLDEAIQRIPPGGLLLRNSD